MDKHPLLPAPQDRTEPTPQDRLTALEWCAQEFITYYRTASGGCSNCGGFPHSTTCFVGRFEAALEVAAPARAHQEEKDDDVLEGPREIPGYHVPYGKDNDDLSRSAAREIGDPHPAAAPDAGEQQDRAEVLARQLHWGQKELDGEDYIKHIERVVALVQTDDEKTVAWLHDLIEDTPTTPGDLRRAGFSEAIIEAVTLLSREKIITSYADYIEVIRAKNNLLAIAVKVADLRDHLRPNCPERLRPRYERALQVLTALPAHQERTEKEKLVRDVLERMKAFATTKPSPQQTRQKSAREMVEHFAYELDEALKGAPARAAEWQQLLREELDAHDWNSSHVNYCWWCQSDVNGKDSPARPHGENCWGVRASALLTARAAEWQPLTTKEKPMTNDPRYFNEKGEYLDGPHYGKDCPVGKVQLEFIHIDPTLRFSPYGYKPSDSAILEVYIDGQRFHITVGTFHDGVAERRGLHIVSHVDLTVEKTSINAASVWLPPCALTGKERKS